MKLSPISPLYAHLGSQPMSHGISPETWPTAGHSALASCTLEYHLCHMGNKQQSRVVERASKLDKPKSRP